MTEPTIRFPVTCPVCDREVLTEFPVALVAIALIQWNNIRLHAGCHDVYWNASRREVEQIREYLGAPGLNSQVARRNIGPRTEGPIIDWLADIQRALDIKAFYIALFAALELPAICCSMEYDDGLTTGYRYISWFDQWLGPQYAPLFNGQQCYAFRGAMLRQGLAGPSHHGYDRIFFLLPGAATDSVHRNVQRNALNLDLMTFCSDTMAAVHAWLAQVDGADPYLTNGSAMVAIHAEGIQPYHRGVAVIG